jgi:uncharacterized protein Yka (UPF0111/DUF47 family)
MKTPKELDTKRLLKRLEDALSELKRLNPVTPEYDDLEWELDDIQDELELRDKEAINETK